MNYYYSCGCSKKWGFKKWAFFKCFTPG